MEMAIIKLNILTIQLGQETNYMNWYNHIVLVKEKKE